MSTTDAKNDVLEKMENAFVGMGIGIRSIQYDIATFKDQNMPERIGQLEMRVAGIEQAVMQLFALTCAPNGVQRVMPFQPMYPTTVVEKKPEEKKPEVPVVPTEKKPEEKKPEVPVVPTEKKPEEKKPEVPVVPTEKKPEDPVVPTEKKPEVPVVPTEKKPEEKKPEEKKPVVPTVVEEKKPEEKKETSLTTVLTRVSKLPVPPTPPPTQSMQFTEEEIWKIAVLCAVQTILRIATRSAREQGQIPSDALRLPRYVEYTDRQTGTVKRNGNINVEFDLFDGRVRVLGRQFSLYDLVFSDRKFSAFALFRSKLYSLNQCAYLTSVHDTDEFQRVMHIHISSEPLNITYIKGFGGKFDASESEYFINELSRLPRVHYDNSAREYVLEDRNDDSE